MIKIFIVYDKDDNAIVGFYTNEDALRYMQLSKDKYKQDTADWYHKELVVGNDCDKLAEAMYG